MRERALLLVLTGACLLSLLVAYWQREAVQEALRDVERLTAQSASKTSRLQSAVKKNVELSERITRLAEESVRFRTSTTEARKAKEALESTVAHLEATLESGGRGRAALEEKVAALESALSGLTAGLQREREATRGGLKELMDLVAAGDSKVLQSLQSLEKRLTTLSALPEKVEELSSRLPKSGPAEARDARLLSELARLSGQLDERKASLRSLNRKIEILGEMLAVDGRPFASAGAPPPKIEATVEAVDAARSEIALKGDVGELRPGHIVWISRDGNAVGRAEVFRVDPASRLAAAKIVWTLSGGSIAQGDRVTTDRPAGEPRAAPEPESSEKDEEDRDDGGEDGEQGDARQSPEGPISSEGSRPGEAFKRSRPPPPPPRPDGDR